VGDYEVGVKRWDHVLEFMKEHNFPPNRVIVIEGLRNFGDVLHTSMVVRHYRQTHNPRNTAIVWGISEKFYKEFGPYTEHVNCRVLPLPHTSPDVRQKWKKYLDKKGLAKCVFPCVAVSGWNIGGNIIDNVLKNAEIKKLHVPRNPFFPATADDHRWRDQFLKKNKINGNYAVLEYNSYTLSKPPHNATWSTEKYDQLVKLIKKPVVFIGSDSDPKLNHGIDGRGCTFRQAKSLIMKANMVIGCGSGLSVIACCENINNRLIEVNIGKPLCAKEIYHRENTSAVKSDDPNQLAEIINQSL